MSAIITDTLKRQLLNNLISDVDSTGEYYYIGIGRSQDWNATDAAPAPLGHLYDERDFRLNMQSIKSAEDVSITVPRNNWSAGSVYEAYDNKSYGNTTSDFYVLTDENSVYICLEKGINTDGTQKPSVTKPTGDSDVSTGDGYTWRYLYSIDTPTATKFLSSNYHPVLTDSDVTAATTPGEIINIVVTDGGSGYSSAPTVTIEGDGTSAAATATISAGVVTKIEMTNRGQDYTKAKISFSSGSATARAVIGQTSGLGANPQIDLKAKAIMFNTKPDGTENGSFIVGNDFRQIGIVKNPTDYSGSAITSAAALGLKSIVLTSTGDAATFTLDGTITGSISGAQAILDYIDSDTLYYHQNETTGFLSFDSDVGSTITSGDATGTVDSHIDSAEFDVMSGDILYIENRAAVTRATDQSEDIKIVIQI